MSRNGATSWHSLDILYGAVVLGNFLADMPAPQALRPQQNYLTATHGIRLGTNGGLYIYRDDINTSGHVDVYGGLLYCKGRWICRGNLEVFPVSDGATTPTFSFHVKAVVVATATPLGGGPAVETIGLKGGRMQVIGTLHLRPNSHLEFNVDFFNKTPPVGTVYRVITATTRIGFFGIFTYDSGGQRHKFRVEYPPNAVDIVYEGVDDGGGT